MKVEKCREIFKNLLGAHWARLYWFLPSRKVNFSINFFPSITHRLSVNENSNYLPIAWWHKLRLDYPKAPTRLIVYLFYRYFWTFYSFSWFFFPTFTTESQYLIKPFKKNILTCTEIKHVILKFFSFLKFYPKNF